MNPTIPQILAGLLGCVTLAGCLGRPPAAPVAERPAVSRVFWDEREVADEARQLRAAFAAEVPRHTACGPDPGADWIAPARAQIHASGSRIDRPQLIVAVDRNPRHQRLCLLLAHPTRPWQALGGARVSTGAAGRHGYFITPTGVFVHSAAILDWRAEGTYNENHIRGLGRKGMRVWDFGWQRASRGWVPADEPGEIRMLLHATDPDVLEARLGHAASKGCIRVSAAMNRFLDHYGVLDADYERAAPTDAGIRALLPPDRMPTRLAGDMLVVIDSSEGR